MSLTAALLAVACGLTCACAMGTMRCAGTRAVERVCLVQDLYYDTQERKFTYHGTAIVNDTQDGIMSPATAATFASATQFLSTAKRNGDFTVEWAEGPPSTHDDSDICTVELPILLRQESPLGTYSYGHMLRDNFYHLIQIPKALGLQVASFAWVTWPRDTGNNAHIRMPLMPKMNKLLSPHHTRRWFELEADCRKEGNMVGPDIKSEMPRYMRIERALIAGAADRQWTHERGPCKAADFRQMRDHAWQHNGIEPRARPRRGDPIRMSVLLKAEGDKRRMFVPQQVLDDVRRAFPLVQVRVHTASQEEEGVQLNWLSRTDILVTNIGSASFRMLYLPDGAQVILAGPLEGPHADEEGLVSEVTNSFWEAETCWDDVPYFRVHRYHVTDPADIDFKPLIAARVSDKREFDAMRRLRDADVTLTSEKLVAVMQDAVRDLMFRRL